MKNGLITVSYNIYPLELENYDLLYAFAENSEFYWQASILKTEVEKIKNNKISEIEIQKIIKSLKFEKKIYNQYIINDILQPLMKDNKKSMIEYKYKNKDFYRNQEGQSPSNVYHKIHFIGKYKINNKLEKIKYYYKDIFVILDKKIIKIKENIIRKINKVNDKLFGIFMIQDSQYDYFRIYAINENKELWMSSVSADKFKTMDYENMLKNKNLLFQKELFSFKFEKDDYDNPMVYNILTSKKQKYEVNFRYELFNKMDSVYEGMGEFGFYAGNFYIDNKDKIKDKIKNF